MNGLFKALEKEYERSLKEYDNMDIFTMIGRIVIGAAVGICVSLIFFTKGKRFVSKVLYTLKKMPAYIITRFRKDDEDWEDFDEE